VKFIATQLTPPREYKPDDIAKLIEDLGHEKLDAREKAERQLALIGQAAEAALRAAESHESPEVRARVRKLLAGLGDVANNDPTTRRQVRAMDILGRIGSAEALEVLQQAAFEPATPAVAVRAQFVLACVGEGGEPLRDAFNDREAKPDPRDVLRRAEF
jgi:HEAT repeat protein